MFCLRGSGTDLLSQTLQHLHLTKAPISLLPGESLASKFADISSPHLLVALIGGQIERTLDNGWTWRTEGEAVDGPALLDALLHFSNPDRRVCLLIDVPSSDDFSLAHIASAQFEARTCGSIDLIQGDGDLIPSLISVLTHTLPLLGSATIKDLCGLADDERAHQGLRNAWFESRTRCSLLSTGKSDSERFMLSCETSVSPMHLAITGGDEKRVKSLLDRGVSLPRNALHLAHSAPDLCAFMACVDPTLLEELEGGKRPEAVVENQALAANLRTWRVSGTPCQPTRPFSPPTFYGRRNEMAKIRKFTNSFMTDELRMNDAQGGGGGLIWLSGPSGAGKSALGKELLNRSCAKFKLSLDLLSGRDAKRWHLTPGVIVAQLLRQACPESPHLNVGCNLGDELAVRATLWQALSRSGGTAVLFEDAENLEQVLPLLPQHLAAVPCLVIVTSRIPLSMGHAVPRLLEISLSPLSEATANSILASLQAPDPSALAKACYGRPLAMRLIASLKRREAPIPSADSVNAMIRELIKGLLASFDVGLLNTLRAVLEMPQAFATDWVVDSLEAANTFITRSDVIVNLTVLHQCGLLELLPSPPNGVEMAELVEVPQGTAGPVDGPTHGEILQQLRHCALNVAPASMIQGYRILDLVAELLASSFPPVPHVITVGDAQRGLVTAASKLLSTAHKHTLEDGHGKGLALVGVGAALVTRALTLLGDKDVPPDAARYGLGCDVLIMGLPAPVIISIAGNATRQFEHDWRNEVVLGPHALRYYSDLSYIMSRALLVMDIGEQALIACRGALDMAVKLDSAVGHPTLIHTLILHQLATIWGGTGEPFSRIQRVLADAEKFAQLSPESNAITLSNVYRLHAFLARQANESQGAIQVLQKAMSLLRQPNLCELSTHSRGLVAVDLAKAVGDAAGENKRTIVGSLLQEGLTCMEHSSPLQRETALLAETIGRLYAQDGSTAELKLQAEALFERAIAIHDSLVWPANFQPEGALEALAALYDGRGANAKAEAIIRRLIAISQSKEPVSVLDLARQRCNLSMQLTAQGNVDEAERLLHESLVSLDTLEASLEAEVTGEVEEATKLNIAVQRIATHRSLMVIHSTNGNAEEGEASARHVLEVASSVPRDQHTEMALPMVTFDLASALLAQAKIEEGIEYMTLALNLFETSHGAYSVELARACLSAADAQDQIGRANASHRLTRRALKIIRKLGDNAPLELRIQVLCAHGGRAFTRDPALLKERLKLFQEAAILVETLLGPTATEMVQPLEHLAFHAQTLYDFEEASKHTRRVLDVWEAQSASATNGADYSRELFVAHNNYAEHLKSAGMLDQAVEHYNKCLEIARSSDRVTNEPRVYITALLGLSSILRADDPGAAEALSRRALAITRAAIAEYNPPIFKPNTLKGLRDDEINALASLSSRLGQLLQFEEADQCIREALEIATSEPPLRSGPDLLQLQLQRVSLLDAQSHHREAIELGKASFQQFDEQIDGMLLQPDMEALVLFGRSDLAALQGYRSRAIRIAEKAVGTSRKHSLDVLELAEHLSNLSSLYAADGNYAKAAQLADEALMIVAHSSQKHHTTLTITSLLNLAEIDAIVGRKEEASGLFEEAMALYGQMKPCDTIKHQIEIGVAQCLYHMGLFSDAAKHGQHAVDAISLPSRTRNNAIGVLCLCQEAAHESDQATLEQYQQMLSSQPHVDDSDRALEGILMAHVGRVDDADVVLRRAVIFLNRSAPNSFLMAMALQWHVIVQMMMEMHWNSAYELAKRSLKLHQSFSRLGGPTVFVVNATSLYEQAAERKTSVGGVVIGVSAMIAVAGVVLVMRRRS